MNELKGFLINREYDKDEVQSQIDKATRLDRVTLLQPTRRKAPLDRVPLIVTYHPGLPPLKSILHKYLPILNVSQRLGPAVKDPPLVAYRRPPNLKDLLVRARFVTTRPPYTGNSQCHQARCKTCQHIRAIDKVKSSVTGKIHRIKASADCKTANVVYVIQCTKCAVQYVGETENALHIYTNERP